MEYPSHIRIEILLVVQVVSALLLKSKCQSEVFCIDSFTFQCHKSYQQRHTHKKKVLRFLFCCITSTGRLPGKMPSVGFAVTGVARYQFSCLR